MTRGGEKRITGDVLKEKRRKESLQVILQFENRMYAIAYVFVNTQTLEFQEVLCRG